MDRRNVYQSFSSNVIPGFMVNVSCMTYNQAPYITETMNGFCIQQTSFPFVCTIMDDCSTDEEQEVIKLYLKENFDLEIGFNLLN